MRGQRDGIGRLFQSKAMRNQRTDIESPEKNESCHFALQGEVGRVTAKQVFFIHTNGGGIASERIPSFGVREQHELSAATQAGLRLPRHVIGGDSDDGGIEAAAAGGAFDEG